MTARVYISSHLGSGGTVMLQIFEILGPFALKVMAFVAGAAIFLPLVAGFAAPFIG